MGRWRTPAAVREDGVGEGQLREGDFAAAEKGCRIGPQFGLDAGLVHELCHALEPGERPMRTAAPFFDFARASRAVIDPS